jgi:hypothetical protein
MASDDIDLDDLVETVALPLGDRELVLDSECLKRLWDAVVMECSASGFQVFEEAFRLTVQQSGDFHIQPGGWTCHLSRGLAKSAVLGPLVVAALTLAGGSAGLAASLVTLILPFLFEIERTNLSRKHEEILLSLSLRDAAQKALSVDELYALLPSDVKAQVNNWISWTL